MNIYTGGRNDTRKITGRDLRHAVLLDLFTKSTRIARRLRHCSDSVYERMGKGRYSRTRIRNAGAKGCLICTLYMSASLGMTQLSSVVYTNYSF